MRGIVALDIRTIAGIFSTESENNFCIGYMAMKKKMLLFILLTFQTVALSAMDQKIPHVIKIIYSSDTDYCDGELQSQKSWGNFLVKKRRSNSFLLSDDEEEEEEYGNWEKLEVPIKTETKKPTKQLKKEKNQQKQSKNIGHKLINLLTKHKNRDKKNQQQRSKAIIAELTDPKTALHSDTSSDEDSSSDSDD